jgi:hypothetical protein
MKISRTYSTDGKEILNVNVGGLFSTLLLVAFIVLKLCHVIEWAWVWVLSPLWIPFTLWLIIVVVVLFIGWIANR